MSHATKFWGSITIGVIVFCGFAYGLMAFIDYREAQNPPLWYLQRHQTARQLEAQSEPTAQVVISGDWLAGRYIPPSLEVETGGDGVVIRGSKQDVYAFYREIYYLNSPTTGPTGLFAWKTQ